jgi:hypothetical protein
MYEIIFFFFFGGGGVRGTRKVEKQCPKKTVDVASQEATAVWKARTNSEIYPTTASLLHPFLYTGVPKRCTHKVSIPYYNVYTFFWDTLYNL